MATNFIQPGDRITHVAAAPIASGDVVLLGGVIAIALANAAIGEAVEVAPKGVWKAPKATGVAIAQGASLRWDVSAGVFTSGGSAASGDVTGSAWAAAPAASAAATVEIYLPGVPGTVTGG